MENCWDTTYWLGPKTPLRILTLIVWFPIGILLVPIRMILMVLIFGLGARWRLPDWALTILLGHIISREKNEEIKKKSVIMSNHRLISDFYYLTTPDTHCLTFAYPLLLKLFKSPTVIWVGKRFTNSKQRAQEVLDQGAIIMALPERCTSNGSYILKFDPKCFQYDANYYLYGIEVSQALQFISLEPIGIGPLMRFALCAFQPWIHIKIRLVETWSGALEEEDVETVRQIYSAKRNVPRSECSDSEKRKYLEVFKERV